MQQTYKKVGTLVKKLKSDQRKPEENLYYARYCLHS